MLLDQDRQPERRNTGRAAPAPPTGAVCQRCESGFLTVLPQPDNIGTVWCCAWELRVRVPPVLATVRLKCSINIPGARSPTLRP